MRRSAFFLTLVAGLAFASSSRAGTVTTYAAIVPAAGATATDIEISYSGTVPVGPITVISETGGIIGTTPTISGSDVSVVFAGGAAASGSIEFSFTSPDISVTNLTLSGVTGSSPLDPIGVVGGSAYTAVPEPASIALLGVGMAGFFAFRRFFSKRPATA